MGERRRWDSTEWIGEQKVGNKGASVEKVDVEKVSLSLTASIPLIWSFVGGLENTPNTQVTREDA